VIKYFLKTALVLWVVYATLAYVGLIDEGRVVAKILLEAFQEIADLVHF